MKTRLEKYHLKGSELKSVYSQFSPSVPLDTNKTSLTKQHAASQVEPLAELQLFNWQWEGWAAITLASQGTRKRIQSSRWGGEREGNFSERLEEKETEWGKTKQNNIYDKE